MHFYLNFSVAITKALQLAMFRLKNVEPVALQNSNLCHKDKLFEKELCLNLARMRPMAYNYDPQKLYNTSLTSSNQTLAL
jgi:hypothetical protein